MYWRLSWQNSFGQFLQNSALRMRNFMWNRFPIKNLLIDSLLTPIVETTYLNSVKGVLSTLFKIKTCCWALVILSQRAVVEDLSQRAVVENLQLPWRHIYSAPWTGWVLIILPFCMWGNNIVIMMCDLCCFLPPQCEALCATTRVLQSQQC